jgi:cell division protein FtsN
MIQKSIIFLMLSCTGGASFLMSGAEFAERFSFFNSEFDHASKKKSIARPKSFYSNRETSNDSASSPKEHYSFFPVLNDPSLSKMVGLNGEIIKRYESSPAPVRKVVLKKKIQRNTFTPALTVVPVQIEKPKVKMAVLATPPTTHQKIEVAPKRVEVETGKAEAAARPKKSNPILQMLRDFPVIPSLDTTAPSDKRVVSKPVLSKRTESWKPANAPTHEIVSYVVQVSASRQMQSAEKLRDALGKKGYAAFIGKTDLPGNKGTWYRVYIGRYFNHAGAKRAAERYYREENREAMVVRQTG